MEESSLNTSVRKEKIQYLFIFILKFFCFCLRTPSSANSRYQTYLIYIVEELYFLRSSGSGTGSAQPREYN
jgi:hypothetical protein